MNRPRRRRTAALETFTCPIYRTRQSSGLKVSDLGAGTVVTGHQVRARCGHWHTLDLEGDRWVVDGRRDE